MAQLKTERAQLSRFSPERLRVEARKEKSKDRALTVFIYAFLIVASLPIILGYGWLLLNSFSETLAYGVLPKGWTIKNFRFLWELPSRYYPDLMEDHLEHAPSCSGHDRDHDPHRYTRRLRDFQDEVSRSQYDAGYDFNPALLPWSNAAYFPVLSAAQPQSSKQHCRRFPGEGGLMLPWESGS